MEVRFLGRGCQKRAAEDRFVKLDLEYSLIRLVQVSMKFTELY